MKSKPEANMPRQALGGIHATETVLMSNRCPECGGLLKIIRTVHYEEEIPLDENGILMEDEAEPSYVHDDASMAIACSDCDWRIEQPLRLEDADGIRSCRWQQQVVPEADPGSAPCW